MAADAAITARSCSGYFSTKGVWRLAGVGEAEDEVAGPVGWKNFSALELNDVHFAAYI